MKILTDEKHALLLSNANSFAAIVEKLVESSEDINPEEITADSIIQALQNDENETALTTLKTKIDQVQAKLTKATEELTAANARIKELEDEMAELDITPATPPATITPAGDAGGEKFSIAQFADKNKGNTEEILAMALESGLI